MIFIGWVHWILTKDLTMSAKFVPKLLTVEEKQQRVEVSLGFLVYWNGTLDFLSTVNTGDASWVLGYDLEAKVQSLECKPVA